MGILEKYRQDRDDQIVKELKAENKRLRVENKELKEWRKRWDAGAAERKWKALGGSW